MKQLSPREKEVINMSSKGDTSKDIARALGISVRTADTHITNLRKKLGARNVQHAVRLCIELGDIVLSSTAVSYLSERAELMNAFINAINNHWDKENISTHDPVVRGVIGSDSHVSKGRVMDM